MTTHCPHPTITMETPDSTTTVLCSSTVHSPTQHPMAITTVEECCYLCAEQNPGDFSPTTRFLSTCLLCSRPFCPLHRRCDPTTTTTTTTASSLPTLDPPPICNINHSTYYHHHPELRGRGIIFPSLGERERILWVEESNRSKCGSLSLSLPLSNLHGPIFV